MRNPKISIVNYKVGNHSSLYEILRILDAKVEITSSKNKILNSDITILPGVGSFNNVMKIIRSKGIDDSIKERHERKLPILGLCLGMQILSKTGLEGGITNGLGIIPGNVEPMKKSKVNIGWSKIKISNKNFFLLKFNNQFFYFNHGFFLNTSQNYIKSSVVGDKYITAIVQKDMNIGLQFHPEKSQYFGVLMLKQIMDYFLNA